MYPIDIAKIRWKGDGGLNPPALTIPYFEVVNLNVDLQAMPAKWGGMIEQVESSRDITLSSHPWVRETGFLVVGLFAKSGTGPAVLDADVAALRAAFHGWSARQLRILHVDGPLDVDPKAEGNWWQIGLQMAYEFEYRRDATGPGFGDENGLTIGAPGTGAAAGVSSATAIGGVL